MAGNPLRIGTFGIGLDAYWPQFPGLRERLAGYHNEVTRRLVRPNVEVADLGMVDTPEAGEAAGHALRRADVDLVILHATTYALSHTVLPAVRRAGVPVLVLNLQPDQAMDYAAFNRIGDRTRMTGEWLAWCASCTLPEMANVFRRAGIPFHQLTGTLRQDDQVWSDLDDWIAAARAVAGMAGNRLGLMGHLYGGMLDIATDLTSQVASFGGHIQIIEVEELAELRRAVQEDEASGRVGLFRREMDVQSDCSETELTRAARTSLALDRLVERHNLGSLAYYHAGTGCAEHLDVMSSVILGCSLLTARGIPVAGEFEVKNAQAMKIMDLLGAGGSFTEFYALDLRDDVVLMGHDGPGHLAIAHGRTKVRPLQVFHGKAGDGLSVEMAVAHGPVTLLSVIEDGDRPALLIAEGDSVAGPILEIGNTNSRYRFPCGARDFAERWNSHGPAHHCAVGRGLQATRLARLAQLLGLACHRVC